MLVRPRGIYAATLPVGFTAVTRLDRELLQEEARRCHVAVGAQSCPDLSTAHGSECALPGKPGLFQCNTNEIVPKIFEREMCEVKLSSCPLLCVPVLEEQRDGCH